MWIFPRVLTMGWSSLMLVVLLAYSLNTLCNTQDEPQAICYNVNVNYSHTSSMITSAPLSIRVHWLVPGTRHRCWNFSVPSDMQVQATCWFNMTERGANFTFYLLENNFRKLLGKSLDLLPGTVILSPRNTLQLVVVWTDLHIQGVTCNATAISEGDSESTCGEANFNISEPVSFTFTIPDWRIFNCTWFITSPNYTIIYIDIVRADITRTEQELLFGRVVRISGNDTTLEGGVTLVTSSPNGTSFYLDGNSIWLSFTATRYAVRATPISLIFRYEDRKGLCNKNQVLCELKKTCLSPSSLCNGVVDCPDYSDEVNCDLCGPSNHQLRPGDVITILGDTPFPSEGKNAPYFAINSGTSESIPNGNGLSIFEYSNTLWLEIECVWTFTEPAGNRLQIKIFEFIAIKVTLRIGSGDNPGYGEPLMVLNDPESLPVAVFSVEPSVWVAFERSKSFHPTNFTKLRFVVTAYNITVKCDDEEFACPSGLRCLNSTAVCDGKRHCEANEDELGCGVCDERYYACASGLCIPRYQRCNKQADCDDMTDEVLCGFCENEEISASFVPYYLVQVGIDLLCTWVITSDPKYRLQLEVVELPACTFRISAAGAVIREIDVGLNPNTPSDRQRSFPPFISLSGPSARITKYMCHQINDKSRVNNFTRIVIRLYAQTVCKTNEFSCTSGPKCLIESAVCDGWGDCPEKEDEYGCGDCQTDQFTCRSGIECTGKATLCDGKNDCRDLSDEFDCGPYRKGRIDLTDDTTVVISTPHWPLFYPDRTQCQWVLVAEVGYRVVVTFLEFHLEYLYDYLYIGNGQLFQNAYLNLTGDKFPLKTASTQNELFLLFVSDEFIEETGFRLGINQIQEVGCGDDEVTCNASQLVCVQNNTSQRGFTACFFSDLCGDPNVHLPRPPYWYALNSPNFPLNYPAHANCMWRIVGSQITIQVLNFRTETERDFLRIRSADDEHKTFELHGNTKILWLFLGDSVVLISFDSDSTVEYSGVNLRISRGGNFKCPNGTFDCLDGSCVLNSSVCDGFKDCQGNGTDELTCGEIKCPGFYQCKKTKDCKYRSVICNGHHDCPLGDDEEDCVHQCPHECSCGYDRKRRLVVSCIRGWEERTVSDIVKITKRLTLSGANISKLTPGLFKGFFNLNELSLSGNGIRRLLSGVFVDLTNLTFLDISNNQIIDFEANSFLELPNLETMIAMKIPVEQLKTGAFNGLINLKTLVLTRLGPRDMSVHVQPNALTDLVSLHELYVDDYRLCCEFVSLSSFTASQCQTTELQPPLNLCGSLMQNNLLRISMWVLGLSALIGNAVVIIQRSICTKKTRTGNHAKKISHSIMVLNLAVSDFMMGVYMLIIAGADLYFGEKYSQVAKEWRSTELCKIAGVLSVMSSEASVFIVTLISVDCFHGIVHPFSSRKLRKQSTTAVILLVWLVSLGLSIGPTVSSNGLDSDIYGLSDVCIGLPLLTKPTEIEIKEGAIDHSFGNQSISIPVATGKKPAWIFSIILFLGVNLACFMVVLFCYVAIFVKVKRTANKVRMAAHRDREIKMAIKMALIVGTDFACWMPVIIMGILSQTGAVVIGPDIYAWTVVFILPINSSLNPYLYTLLTSISEYRSKSKNQSTFSTNTKSLDTLSLSISNKTQIQDTENTLKT